MDRNRATFAKNSANYARFRPSYPAEWYEFLYSHCLGFETALDCGTGNGQVAVDLAKRFSRVIAIDSSTEQIQNAFQNEKVEYKAVPAEEFESDGQLLDLVTCAQSLHWFDLSRFYPRIKKMLRPGALFAAWGYRTFTVDPLIDHVIQEHFHAPIDPYWSGPNRVCSAGYRDIEFPFDEIKAPPLLITRPMIPRQLLAFLGTWSALSRYEEETGTELLEPLAGRLEKVWPAEEKKIVSMRIHARVGKNP